MRIAYLINQYPKVSHTFIRREIHALERQGFEVLRIALRGWDGDLIDAEDLRERAQTRYVLQCGACGLVSALLMAIATAPKRFFAAMLLAIRMSSRADRSFIYHIAYLAEACRVLPWLKASGVAHVHAHFGTNAAEVAMLARVLGAQQYSFTIHGPEEFDKPQFLGISEKIRRSAFTVAVSSYGRSQLYRWVAHSEWQKIEVVHCGLEQGFHNIVLPAFPQLPRLVCVGRLCEQKGQLLLVEAASRLAARGVQFELVLAGDGEMRGDIEGLIEQHGLGRHISITGWISSSRVREEILAAQGLVLPSFAEGLPVVIMEAMALGRPVLSTYVAGIPELVRPKENGWLFPAGSVDALVAAIEDFFATPLPDLERLGMAGRERVLQRHDADREAAKLAALFRQSHIGTAIP